MRISWIIALNCSRRIVSAIWAREGDEEAIVAEGDLQWESVGAEGYNGAIVDACCYPGRLHSDCSSVEHRRLSLRIGVLAMLSGNRHRAVIRLPRPGAVQRKSG